MSKTFIVGLLCILLLAFGVVAVKIHVGPVTVGVGGSSEEGVLTLRGRGTKFPIFPDEETLVDATRAASRHDAAAEDAALDRAAARGAFIVSPGIRVRILERRHPPVAEIARVEILEGGAIGKTGWTLAESILAYSAGPADPCALVTRAELEQVSGLALREPERGAGDSCTFKPLDENQAAGFLVTLHSGNDTRGLFEAYKTSEQRNGAQVTPLDGLGDAAYVLEKQPSASVAGTFEQEINVLRHQAWFSLTALGKPIGSTGAITALAQKALARLP